MWKLRSFITIPSLGSSRYSLCLFLLSFSAARPSPPVITPLNEAEIVQNEAGANGAATNGASNGADNNGAVHQDAAAAIVVREKSTLRLLCTGVAPLIWSATHVTLFDDPTAGVAKDPRISILDDGVVECGRRNEDAGRRSLQLSRRQWRWR